MFPMSVSRFGNGDRVCPCVGLLGACVLLMGKSDPGGLDSSQQPQGQPRTFLKVSGFACLISSVEPTKQNMVNPARH